MATHNNIVFTVFKGSKDGDIIQSETSRPALAGDEVVISTSASGLCGGDLLFKGNDVRLLDFHFHPKMLINRSDGSWPRRCWSGNGNWSRR